jgi:hypothetical protein
MSRFDNGWIKIWRLKESHWLNKDPKARLLWWQLLTMATYKPSKIKTGGKIIDIPAGTVVTSKAELAELCGFSLDTSKRLMKLLESTQQIAQRTSRQGSIITICNWSKYQGNQEDDQPTDQPTDQPIDQPTHQPTDQPLSEEDKKLRREETPLTPRGGMTPNDLMNIWNENRGRLRKCASITKLRRGWANARLLECSDPEEWTACVKAIADNPFYNGQNDRGWIADFDFLVRTQTLVRYREGFFNKKPKREAQTIVFEWAKPKSEGGIL